MILIDAFELGNFSWGSDQSYRAPQRPFRAGFFVSASRHLYGGGYQVIQYPLGGERLGRFCKSDSGPAAISAESEKLKSYSIMPSRTTNAARQPVRREKHYVALRTNSGAFVQFIKVSKAEVNRLGESLNKSSKGRLFKHVYPEAEAIGMHFYEIGGVS